MSYSSLWTILPLVTSLGVIGITIFLARRLYLSSNSKVTLKDKNTKYPLKLIHKKNISHNVRLFRFQLPQSNQSLGLYVGQYIYLTARINNSLVIRPYTPISPVDVLGYMELLIKVYPKDTNPNFPKGGKMTQYLESLNPGDVIEVRGPSGLLTYQGRGEFNIRLNNKSPAKIKNYKNVCMVAGGSGITPMFQLILHILREEDDDTKLSLLYANQTEDDILLRDSLDDMTHKHQDRFKCHYTLSKPPPDWSFSNGRIDSAMLERYLAPPSDDTLVTLCGPPGLIQTCQSNLEKLGHDAINRFEF